MSANNPRTVPTRIRSVEPIAARVGTRNQLVVKVTSEDGVIGWGEAGFSGREQAVAATIKHFADFLVGRDCREIGRLWQECYRSQYFEGGRVITAAISAIDIALHDLLGKTLNVPVYQLIGGKQRERVPAYASCYAESYAGNVTAFTEAVLDEVAGLVEDGWTSIRVPVAGHSANEIFEPRESINETARRIIAIRERFGMDLMLGIDYHHRLSVAETASFAQRLPAAALDYIEEPIRDETPEAYRALRKLTTIPFAIGEEFSSKWQAAPYIEENLTQFLRIDISNIGGFTEAMKVIGWAEMHYIELMPHNPLGAICTAATVHMAAATALFSYTETHQLPNCPLGFHHPDIFPTQHNLVGDGYPVLDAPGLGIEVNEEALRRSEALNWNPPFLRRRDGSLTNW
ncbi:galactonate dehydratase [Xaviernesmea oryzae]|uniref:Galactonate dehydratase n=1 Tax=Xaviernesmea oryzae TaxID=464029 RepID=A0A1Q9AWA8_9HYPH|nr:mandelate racemase/muconate lactonizing enzyme family protein [Xaviernesmea oryzae]OLP59695.1 galactonate dehydratase [Xaviernesmea oryzae]